MLTIIIQELYEHLTGEKLVKELGAPAYYDYKIVHADIFGGKEGYICSKSEALEYIKKLIN